MNERQKARRKRFAEYRLNFMKRHGIGQQADVQIGKTPRRSRLHLAGDCFLKFESGGLIFQGNYGVEHWRRGRHLDTYAISNNITNEGLTDNLDVYFDEATQPTTFYMGLIDVTGLTALDDTDIYDDINQAGNGWDEFTSYTDANNGDNATTRPVWPTDNPTGNSVTNSTQAIYDITAGGSVHGVFLVCKGTAPQTKGDHQAGSILWSTAPFSGGNVGVANGDQLRATYTVNASHSP